MRTKADRLRAVEAEKLRQLVIDFAADHRVPDRAASEIIAAIDRETSSSQGWTFCMISPQANAAIVKWLAENSTRRLAAVQLWAELFQHLDRNTGEIVRSREELAAAIGIEPRHVSEIMTELESINAISRRKGSHGVRYYMSPLAGTHLTGAARPKAQAKAAALTFAPRPKKKAKLVVVPPTE